MKKIKMLQHGGAGPDSEFIRLNKSAIEASLKEVVEEGYKILYKGGSALDAVTNAVVALENDPLFNSGRGSALNENGEVEMDASIMDGKRLRSGAVSMVREVKNPILLAKYVLENTSHVLLSGYGALDLAKDEDLQLEPASYFITDHQVNEFLKKRDEEKLQDRLRKKVHGTVGALAMDRHGNLAAATSTGGTTYCLEGRDL
jgi:beta-aspartyl-peptidase (threonine type)